MTARLSPGSGGELIDPEGKLWGGKRRHLDVRKVKSLLKREDVPALLCEAVGSGTRWVGAAERSQLWDQVRVAYRGPDRNDPPTRHVYDAFEFTDADGSRILYIERGC